MNNYQLNEDGLIEIYSYFVYLRKKNNISQKQIANYLKLTNTELSRLEKIKVTSKKLITLLNLCNLYNISDKQFLEFYNLLSNKTNDLNIIENNIITDVIKEELNKEAFLKMKQFLLSERLRLNMSLKDVEGKINISNAEISRVENIKYGIPSLYSLIPLCNLYNISDDIIIRFYQDVLNINNIIDYSLYSKEELINIIKEKDYKIKEQKKIINNIYNM